MKKFGSKMLIVFMMLVSQLNIAAVQAETRSDDVSYTKTATVVPGTVNTWDITLEVKGRPNTTKSSADIVLVLDISSSMQGTRLAKLKVAAKEFVTKILGPNGNPGSKISLVTFSRSAQEIQTFTNNVSTLHSKIDGLSVDYTTFLQGGIKVGRDVLAAPSSTSANKHMVVMTDGMPNVTYTIDYKAERESYITTTSKDTGSNPNTIWADNVPESYFNYGSTREIASATTSLIRTTYPRPYNYEAANSAIAESRFAKAKGQSIFTIGLETNTETAGTLSKIASPGQNFTATTESLSAIYDKIANEIQTTMTEAKIKDVMADGFEITAANVANITKSQGSVTYDAGTGVLDWNIGSLSTKDPVDPTFNSAKLTYRVEITDKILTAGLPLDGLFPTNKSADLTYKDTSGAAQTKPVASPMVDPTFFSVQKILRTKDGTAIADDSLTFSIGVNNATAGFSNNSALHPNEMTTYTTLRKLGDYIVTEDLQTIFKQVIIINGVETLLVDGDSSAIFKIDETRKDQTIQVYNTEKMDPAVTALKKVVDDSKDGYAEAKETLHYTLEAKNTSDVPYRNLFIQDQLLTLIPHVNDPKANIVTIVNDGVTTTKTVQELITGFYVRLNAGKTITLSFDVVVKDAINIVDVPKLANIATIGPETPKTEIPTGHSVLTSSKSVSDASGNTIAEPNEVLTYTIKASNSGNVAAKGVMIKDTLSSIIDHINDPSATDVTITNAGIVSTKKVSELMTGFTLDIGAGKDVSIEFKVTVKGDIKLDTVLKLDNIAMVGSKENPATIPTGGPKLTSLKKVQDANYNGVAEAGEVLYYTIVATNNGTVATSSILIKDDLAQLLPYVKDPKANVLGITETGFIAPFKTVQDLMNGLTYTIPAGGEIILTFSVVVIDGIDPSLVNNLVNTAHIGPQEKTATIPTGKLDLAPKKTVVDGNNNGFAEAGETLSYKLELVNNSSFDANDQLIKDSLDHVLPYVNNTDSVIVYANNGGTLKQYTMAELIAGFKIDLVKGQTFTATFDVVVIDDLKVDLVKKISNLATIGVDVPEVEIPTGAPKLVGTKSVLDGNNNGFAEAGETLTYTLTLVNNGNIKAIGAPIQDTLSMLLPYVNDPKDNNVTVAQGANISIIKVSDLIGGFTRDIGPGETVKLTFSVVVINGLNSAVTTELANKAILGPDRPEVKVPTGSPKLTSNKEVLDANDNDFAEPGETLHYKLTVTNSGEVDKVGYPIQDTLSDLLPHIVDPSTNPLVMSNGETLLSVADLMSGLTTTVKAGETLTIEFDVVVKSTLNTDLVTHLRNKAVMGDDRPETEIPTGSPKISGTKAVKDANENGYAEPGEKLFYTLTIKNTGLVKGTDILIQDTLIDLLPHVEDPSLNLLQVSNGMEMTVQDLIDGFKVYVSPDNEFSFTFYLVVKEDIDTNEIKTLRNVAVIGENEPEVEIPTGSPKLSSNKAVQDHNENGYAEVGETLYYTIRVSNDGPVDATEVMIQDELSDLLAHVNDPSLNVLKISDHADMSVQDLMDGFKLTVPHGKTITITFELVVSETLNTDEIKVLKNMALVGKDKPTAEIPTGSPRLSEFKSVLDANENGYAEPGETLRYTLTVKNSGSVNANDVFVQDELSDLLAHIEDPKANPVEISNSDGVKVQDLMDGFSVNVKPGETVTIVFEVKVKADLNTDVVKFLRNKAIIGDDTPEIEIPTASPKLSADKAVLDENKNRAAEPGEVLAYTLSVRNDGLVAARDVLIKDDFAGAYDYFDHSFNTVVTVDNDGVISTHTLKELMTGFKVDIAVGKELKVMFSLRVLADLDLNSVRVIRNVATVNQLRPEAKIDTPVPVIPKTPEVPKTVLPSTGVQAVDNGLAIALIVGGILLVFKALRKKVD